MKREVWQPAIHGVLFLYLLFNFFTEEYSWYRNTILITFVIGYTALAVIYHLEKNDKI